MPCTTCVDADRLLWVTDRLGSREEESRCATCREPPDAAYLENAVRSYGGDKNITVIDTTVEWRRGCFQLLCVGDVTLVNVTVREAGDFSFDLSSGKKGKVVMKNCRADIAYNPLFNLTRGAVATSTVCKSASA